MEEKQAVYFPAVIRRRMFYSAAAATLLVLFGVWSSWLLWQRIEAEHAYQEQVLHAGQRQLLAINWAIEKTNQQLLSYLLFADKDYLFELNTTWSYQILPRLDSLANQEKSWKSIDDRTRLQGIRLSTRKLMQLQQSFVKDYDIEQELRIEKQLYEEALNEISLPDDSLDPAASADNENTAGGFQLQFRQRITQFSNRLQKEIELLIFSFDGQVQLSNQAIQQYRFLLIFEGVAILVILFVLMLLGSRWAYMRLWAGITKLHLSLQQLAEMNEVQQVPILADELGKLSLEVERINNNMHMIRHFAQQVAQGQLQDELAALPKGNVGQSIRDMRQALIRVANQEQERNWINEGLNLFSDVLRRTDNLQQMYDELMRELVRYVGAQQAALFVLRTRDDQSSYLELASFYAYDRKRFLQKEIMRGEGLVGQCWAEGNTIYLLKVPEQYIEIAAGMGSEKPRSLLIVPLKARGQTLGVIELASFTPFSDKARHFVEELAGDVGSTLLSIQSTEQTRQLLIESQKNTEQMHQRETALQKEIDRLSVEVRKLKAEAREYHSLVQAIRERILFMEFDSSGNFTYVNERFCEVTGYSKEELLGKSRSLYAPIDVDPADFNLLWAQLMSGVYLEKELKRLKKDGSPFWMRAQMFPIMGENGDLKKVLVIATDITAKVQSTQRMLRSQQELSAKQLAFERVCISIETDKHYHIIDINDYTCRLLGISREQAIQAHIDELILGRIDFDDLTRRLEQDEWTMGDVLMAAGEFQYKYIRLAAVAAKNINQEIEHVFFIGFDLSADKHREIDLAGRMQALEQKVHKLERSIEEMVSNG